MNILIGKIGKAIKFKNLDLRTGGDSIIIFYSNLSRMFPEHNFYFGGPSQLEKLTKAEYNKLFPNGNVFSAYTRAFDNKNREDEYDFGDDFKSPVKFFKENNITIDFALLMSGMCSSNANIPDFVPKGDGSKRKFLAWTVNYAAPYLYTLNELGCPFYMISEDARYITANAGDLYNHEKLVFSQINGTFTTLPRIKSKTDFSRSRVNVPVIYSGCEKIFMAGCSKDWRSNIDFDRKLNSTGDRLIVLSNGHGIKKINTGAGTNNERLSMYKKYVIDNLKDTEYANTKIYGKWDDETYENYPSIINRPMIELQDEIADARYTFIYSIAPGFVTVKPMEMIMQGLIPFIHPDYDIYGLLDIPEYCYIKDEQDLINKMRELDNDPVKYKEVFDACMNCVKQEDLNGSAVINTIMGRIYQDFGLDYTNREGCESIFNRFSKNMF
jgi:hypothetical protein